CSSRRRHTRFSRDWSSDVCSSDLASFAGRRESIARQLHAQAESLGATIGDDAAVAALLDEVTALVEFPVVYVGQFDQQFLQVPRSEERRGGKGCSSRRGWQVAYDG